MYTIGVYSLLRGGDRIRRRYCSICVIPKNPTVHSQGQNSQLPEHCSIVVILEVVWQEHEHGDTRSVACVSTRSTWVRDALLLCVAEVWVCAAACSVIHGERTVAKQEFFTDQCGELLLQSCVGM